MAITVIQEPGEVSLSKNQIPLILQSNSFIQTAGEAASYNIGLLSLPIVEGEQLIFNFKGFEHVYTFVNDVTSNPTCSQIRRNDEATFDFWEEWIMIEVIPKLRQNYYLEKYFSFVQDYLGTDVSVYITAKSAGAEFNLNIAAIDAVSNPSISIIPTTVNSGVNQVLKTNYKLYCEVFITNEDNNGFISAGTAEANVNESGVAEFNLQSILHPYLKSSLAEHLAFNLKNINFSNRIFYYTFGEKYGSPVKFYCHNTPNEDLYYGKRVLLAGIDTEEFARAKLTNFYNNFIGNEKQLLTLNQTVYLPRAVPEVFICNINQFVTAYRVSAIAYLLAGGSISYDSSIINLVQNATIGFKLKSLFPAAFLSTVSRVTFQVKNIFNFIYKSSLYTIHFIDKQFLNTRYFCYRNSFGVYEVFFATEAQNQTLKVDDIQNFERQLPLNYTADNIQFGQMDKQFTQEFEINTGYIGVNPNQDARNYSANLKAELLLTTDTYVFNNGTWQPIIINSNSFGIPGPQNHDFGFTLKYKFAYSSPSPIFNTFI